MVAPVRATRAVAPKDDVGIQTAIPVTKYDVESQSGTVTNSSGVQVEIARSTNLTSNFQVQARIPSNTCDVSAQSGTVHTIASTQTEALGKQTVPVKDASVQCRDENYCVAINKKLQVALSPTFRDTTMQSEEPLQVDVVAPIQRTLPTTPKDDIGVQAEVVRPRHDVEAQSGVVNAVGSTQTITEYRPKVSVTDAQMVAIPHPIDWTGETESVLQADVVAPVLARRSMTSKVDSGIQTLLVPKRCDVELQLGVMTESESTQTDRNSVRDMSMEYIQPVASAAINKKLQVSLSPIFHDTTIQSEEPVQVDVVAPIQRMQPTAPKDDAITQVRLQPKTYDVEVQYGRLFHSQGFQTEKLYKPSVSTQDAQVYAIVRPGSNEYAVQTEEEQLMQVTHIQAPIIHKDEMGVQTEIPVAKYDVELQSGVLTECSTTQTDQVRQLQDSLVQKDILTNAINKKLQVAIKPICLDATTQCEDNVQVDVVAPVKLAPPVANKEDIGLQTALNPTKCDASLQIGVRTNTSITQTIDELKPVPLVEDAHIQHLSVRAEPMKDKDLQVHINPPVNDMTVQTDSTVQLVVSKSDRGIQAIAVPAKYDVEAQIGVQTQPYSVQTLEKSNAGFMDSTFESEEPIQMDVVAPIQRVRPVTPKDDIGVQTDVAPAKYDVELQSGVITDVGVTQTVEERTSLPHVNEASMQHSQPPPSLSNKKLQVAISPAPIDSAFQSEEPIQMDVVAPIQRVRPATPKDDIGVQADVAPVKYDVESQSGVITDVGVTQTVEEDKPHVRVNDASMQHAQTSPALSNKKLQVAISPAPIDSAFQSEEPIQMDVVAPIQRVRPAIPKDDVGVQVDTSSDKYDVEIQSGLVTQVCATQTTEEYRPIVPMDEAGMQHSQPPPVLSSKKLQVAISPAPIDNAFQSEEPVQMDVVAPIQHVLKTTPKNDMGVQAEIAPDKYDVELQTGVITDVGVAQTVEEQNLHTRLEDASMQHSQPALSMSSKKLQVAISPAPIDSAFQSEEPIQLDVLATVQRVHPAKSKDDMGVQVKIVPDKYDVEIQSGVITEVGVTQTTEEQKPLSRVNEIDMQHHGDSQPVQLNKKCQVSILSDVIDSRVQTLQPMPYQVKYDVKTETGTVIAMKSIQTVLEAKLQDSCSQTCELLHEAVCDSYAQTELGLLRQSVEAPLSAAVPHIDTLVTSVSYQESVPIFTNKKLQAGTRQPIADTSVQTDNLLTSVKPILCDTVTRSAPRTQEYQQSSGLIQSTTSFAHFHQKRMETCVSQGQQTDALESTVHITHLQVPVHSGISSVLIDNAISSTLTQRNKKCQVSLLESSTASSMARELPIAPKINVDTECQIKPPTLNKKMQINLIEPTRTSKPSSSDVQTITDQSMSNDVWTQYSGMELSSSTMIVKTTEKPVSSSYETSLSRVDRTMESERITSVMRRDAATDAAGAKYVTQVVQAEAPVRPKSPIYRTQLVTTYSAKVQSERPVEVRHESHQQYPPQPIELTGLRQAVIDAACEVNITPPSLVRSHYVNTNVQMNVPTKEISIQAGDMSTEVKPQTRHVRIQKGGSWLACRHQDAFTQSDTPEAPIEEQKVGSVKAVPKSDVVDAAESVLVSRVGSGPSSVISPPGSVRGSRILRPDVVSWGVQCTPHTLNGVTQTSDLYKADTGYEVSSQSVRSASVGIQTKSDEDYIIKRVVTTIARKGATSSYRRGAPVVRQMQIRGRTPLLSSSLPSNLDEQFLAEEDDDEVDDELQTPLATKKVTTTHSDGTRRVVREELFTEVRDRGRSLDSHLEHHDHSGKRESYGSDPLDIHEEIELQAEAEHCFTNLINLWGASYLLTRIRRRNGCMSVDRDLATTSGSGPTRLIGAKTQYTSTGSLHVTKSGVMRSMETQTTGLGYPPRPPHKNKRIQRGPSYLFGTVTQASTPGVEGSQVSYPRQRSAPNVGYTTTTFTESVREQMSSYEPNVSGKEDYICPKCGTHAHLAPYSAHSTMQSQQLPITQLRSVPSQTKSSGFYSLNTEDQTLPVYLSDEELYRINPRQELAEERDHSVITWYAAEDSERSTDITGECQARDEVWVDNPGKLLEMRVTGVTVPGTNKVISAAEAFYRGILRIVYWDYTKVGSRQSLSDLGAAVPLTDAVLADAVKLAADQSRTKSFSPHSVKRTDQGTSALDAHVVWTAPEKRQNRYIVHALRPEVHQVGTDSTRPGGPVYNVSSALRAGYIDRETGQIVLKGSSMGRTFDRDQAYLHDWDVYSEQSEYLSIQEAINRGILDAELTETESPSQSRTGDTFRAMSLYSSPHLPRDMDV
ncbi:hypothetical protein EG68_05196 [Paragonimus skrjabini miyazakii]|uniref:Uncharacterized protein n=1 Tax=Paragonimus skrjabini miyazakii TaxID=59628 RepID=A0A8S9YXG7_9TREM|nr:hypothetical protein EG68_05196 [Paragonimus skrjabini miyazakii]